jgi:basic membrane protein A
MSKFAPKAVLTCPIWNWAAFYIPTVKAVMEGTWKSSQYWGGWKDGVVDLSPIGPMVPEDVKTMALAEADLFKKGEKTIFTIFTGPLKDQKGEERVAAGVAMTDQEILNMNWFVEGVEGEIPS